MRNCSKRELLAFLAAHVDPTLRAWVRYYGRGPPIRARAPDPRVGPLIRAWAL